MSRSEEFHSARLFHGSSANMAPGTVIQPGGSNLAWATSDLDTASHYANQDHSLEASKDAVKRLPKDSWKQGALFNPVYEVSPVNPKDVIENYYDTGYTASPSGFKVNRLHSWTSPEEVDAKSAKEREERLKLKANRKSGI